MGGLESLQSRIDHVRGVWDTNSDFIAPPSLQHLGIICDGNRRWAEEQGLPSYFGHRVGVEVIKGIARITRNWGVKALTFWVWSTENWNRNDEQVSFVMQLAEEFLPKEELLQDLQENGVRFTHLGRKDRLSATLSRSLEQLEIATAQFNDYYLNLALDYGGLDEVARGIQKMFDRYIKDEFSPGLLGVNEKMIYDFLDTAGQPLPDLVIRTGVKDGEVPHTSGFMPLQSAYSGWGFIEDLFPSLTPEKLISQIRYFEGYKRRLGQ